VHCPVTAAAAAIRNYPQPSNHLPLRVVLDTNVLLSLWVFDKYPCGSRLAGLRWLIRAGRLQALSRPDCLTEFERVLGYPEFRLSPQQQRRILAEYQAALTWLPPLDPAFAPALSAPDWPLPRCSDRDDQKFLELAREGNAHLLLTSDRALLKLARRPALAGRFRILMPEHWLVEQLLGMGYGAAVATA